MLAIFALTLNRQPF